MYCQLSTEKTTRKEFQRDREKRIQRYIVEILEQMKSLRNKMDTTNKLLRHLLKVCDNPDEIKNNYKIGAYI